MAAAAILTAAAAWGGWRRLAGREEATTAEIVADQGARGAAPIPGADPAEEKEYFVLVERTSYGPYSASEIRSMVRTRTLHPLSLVSKKGATEWSALQSFREFERDVPKVEFRTPEAGGGATIREPEEAVPPPGTPPEDLWMYQSD